jgi:hypothetical protein
MAIVSLRAQAVLYDCRAQRSSRQSTTKDHIVSKRQIAAGDFPSAVYASLKMATPFSPMRSAMLHENLSPTRQRYKRFTIWRR